MTQRRLRKIKLFLFPPKKSREAFDAYYFRLPENITVDWERDGDFIVGRVSAGDNKFVTQGKSADDFVEMVNDAIYTSFGIPLEYFEDIRNVKPFYPPIEERRKLEDLNIKGNTLSIKRNNHAMQTA